MNSLCRELTSGKLTSRRSFLIWSVLFRHGGAKSLPPSGVVRPKMGKRETQARLRARNGLRMADHCAYTCRLDGTFRQEFAISRAT